MPRVALPLVCLALAVPTVAAAQPAAGPRVAATDEATPVEVQPRPPSPAIAPAPHGLRNGFSLSAGQEFGGDRDVSGTMFGVDWRIGWKINAPLSVYLDTHVSFGSAKEGNGAAGVTGTIAAAALAEYELPMRLFVAAGGGWGVLNNPNGPMAQARVGYYPFASHGAGKSRRLNVALDYRAVAADQGYGTVNHVALSLGYDRF